MIKHDLIDKEELKERLIEEFKKHREEMSRRRGEMKSNPTMTGKVYLHIGNSGVTFSVQDEGFGPTIKISGSAFGNMESTLLIHTDNESLQKLGEMFIAASDHKYSQEYVNKASSPAPRRCTEDSKS